MLKPVHLEEWRSLFPLQRAMPIESPPVSRVPDVAAYAPPEDEARMLPRPLVWLSFGAGEPVGETMRTRPTPLPT